MKANMRTERGKISRTSPSRLGSGAWGGFNT